MALENLQFTDKAARVVCLLMARTQTECLVVNKIAILDIPTIETALIYPQLYPTTIYSLWPEP